MMKTLDFYFDFSSPFAYFGSLFVEDLGVETTWRPYLMGAAMKQTGIPPLIEIPLKRDYMAIDLRRMTRLYGVEFSFPSYFPFMSVKVARAFYLIEETQGQPAAKAFAAKVMAAVWGKGPDMSNAEAIADLAGVEGLESAITGQAIKDRLRAQTDAAIGRGCWGSPHFFINEGDTSEHFWGCDKRDEMERWLTQPW